MVWLSFMRIHAVRPTDVFHATSYLAKARRVVLKVLTSTVDTRLITAITVFIFEHVPIKVGTRLNSTAHGYSIPVGLRGVDEPDAPSVGLADQLRRRAPRDGRNLKKPNLKYTGLTHNFPVDPAF
jgi:hypothetical protein